MTDILDYLQADLDALRALIFELRIADEDSEQEATAFTALVTLVKAQDEAQTKLFQPLVGFTERLAKALGQRTNEMDSARDVEATIECCTNRATWRASVNIYCELLENRISHEMRNLLPALFDELSPEERRKLGASYRKLRGFTRTVTERTDWRRIWASVFNRAG